MVKTRTAAPSRAATVVSSRGANVARDIMKKRDKPYKTEQHRVLAKKRKLDIRTSYRSAPLGYSFLEVGTPELAERCKKMSREKGYPVNVVNTAPKTRRMEDPNSLSHHVHRIGYHFRSEIVEEACTDLGYMLFKGKFVKEAELARQKMQGRVRRHLLNYGLVSQDGSGDKESPDQVRGAIKELFPNIPEDDLENIANYAWQTGTDRVGNAEGLDLPRRVQLAVIARIRHQYTDYDQLLRAFEWSEARRLCEPICLQKLIEWRGENEDNEDGELEEIVRETIIIDDDDDDDDDVGNGSEADDEDSIIEIADDSDASIEVTHHLADDTDIGAESAYDARRPFHQGPRQAPRRSKRLAELNKNIAVARKQVHNRHVHGQPPVQPRLQRPPGEVRLMQGPGQAVNSNHNRQGPLSTFEQDGIVYRLIPEEVPPRPQQPTGTPNWLQRGFPQDRAAQASTPGSRFSSHPSTPAHGPPFNQPVPSIERDYAHQRVDQTPACAAQLPHSTTPYEDHAAKRRRVDNGASNPPAFHGVRPPQYAGTRPSFVETIDLTTPERPRQQAPNVFSGGFVDLTSPAQPRSHGIKRSAGEVINVGTPESQYRPTHPSLLREVQPAPLSYNYGRPSQYKQAPNDDAYRPPPPLRVNLPPRTSPNGHVGSVADDAPYDPRQPLLQLPQQVDRLHIQPEQQGYNVDRNETTAPAPASRFYQVPQQLVHSQPPAQRPHAYPASAAPPQVYFQQYPSRATPQPVHGAPAPVQTVPRDVPTFFYQPPAFARAPTVPPPAPPADGAPHPAQYLPR